MQGGVTSGLLNAALSPRTCPGPGSVLLRTAWNFLAPVTTGSDEITAEVGERERRAPPNQWSGSVTVTSSHNSRSSWTAAYLDPRTCHTVSRSDTKQGDRHSPQNSSMATKPTIRSALLREAGVSLGEPRRTGPVCVRYETAARRTRAFGDATHPLDSVSQCLCGARCCAEQIDQSGLNTVVSTAPSGQQIEAPGALAARRLPRRWAKAASP